MDFFRIITEKKLKYINAFDPCNVFVEMNDDWKISDHKSSSPTAVVFGQFIKNFPGHLVNTGISLKIFLDITEPPVISGKKIPKSVWDVNMGEQRKKYGKIYGLKYEMLFYTKIVGMIIKNHLSPNFVIPFAYTMCNSYVLGAKQKIIETLLSKYPNKYVYALWEHLKIGIMITEKVGKNIFPVFSLWQLVADKALTDEELNKIVFQVVYAIGILCMYKSVHNDLHIGNVLVEKRIKPVKFAFFYRNRRFVIETRYVPYLFDWDIAYSDLLGNNKKLSGYTCLENNVCNKFSDKVDLYTFFCTMNFKTKYGKLYKNLNLQPLRSPSTSRIINISDEARERISRENKQSNGTYKMSGEKLAKLIDEQKINGLLQETMGGILFKLSKNYIEILQGFHCRPVFFDESYPTPMHLLENYFTEFSDTKTEVEKENTYFFPAKRFVSSVYIDPAAPSTRDKIQGKPKFSEPPRYGAHVYEIPEDFEK